MWSVERNKIILGIKYLFYCIIIIYYIRILHITFILPMYAVDCRLQILHDSHHATCN